MLPTDPKARKAIPVSSGCFAYFPDALIALAQLSALANEQHNPGEPLHWAKEKSTDEADALARHQLQHIKGELYDTDRVLHATKVFWRAGAQLQRLLTSGVAPLAPETKDPINMTATEERIRQAHPLTQVPAGPGRLPCLYVRGNTACRLNIGHAGSHWFGLGPVPAPPTPRPPIFCFDCGVDLDEQDHAQTCLWWR